MTTPKNAGQAAGRAAALPAASLAPELDALNRMAEVTHDGIAYQVAPLLRAAENLADCRRTLDLITLHAAHDPGFKAQLVNIDPAYNNHDSEFGGFELIQNLLRVAVNMLDDHTRRMEQMGSDITALKGRAAGIGPAADRGQS